MTRPQSAAVPLVEETRSPALLYPAIQPHSVQRACSARNVAQSIRIDRPSEHGAVSPVPWVCRSSLGTGFAEPAREPGPEAPPEASGNAAKQDLAAAAEAFVGMPLAKIERMIVEATIRACGDSIPKAARVLGVSPSTLYRKLASWSDQSGAQ